MSYRAHETTKQQTKKHNMKRPNITPGPWEAQGYLNDIIALPACKMVSAVNRGAPELDSAANARAIAALPELLEALEAALLRLDDHDEQSAPEALQIRQALTKAGYTFNE